MESFFSILGHLFTPRYTNNHRPRILHATPLIGLSILLVCIQLFTRTIHIVRPDILGIATNITIEKLLEYTNQERKAKGLQPLQFNQTLARAAEKKAQHMFLQNYWAHNAPDGTTPWDFILDAGYEYSYAGENLARDFDDSQSVVNAWMDSPSHKDNLLRSEYDEIGFAVVNGELNGHETTLVVQMFGKPQGTHVARTTNQVNQQNIPLPSITAVPTSTFDINAPRNVAVKQAGVVREPLISGPSFNKSVAFLVMGVLLTVLVLDGFLIWRRKTIRVAGHNMAHFIFLVAMLGAVILGTAGAIL